MAAYPPGPSRLFQLPDLAGGQAPGDLAYLVDVSLGTNAGDPSDVKSSLNDLFAEITKNVSDLSIQFANGLGTATVSAANKGKIRYNSTAQSFQVSENGGAYENLVKGSGANTQVAYWTAADVLAGDTAFLWDATNDRLLINVSVVNGAAPIDVSADATAIAQRWRETAGGPALIEMQVPASFGQLGTVSNHDFALITNGVQHLNVEATGAVVVGSITVATATLLSNAIAATDIALIANNAAASSVDIARFQVAGSNRFRFTQLGEAVFGLASTLDGKLTLASAGAATLQSLQAGTAPAATNTFRWPNADPTAGQALTASAPAAGVVTLSWTTVGGGSPSAPVGSIQFNNPLGSFDGDAGLLWDTVSQQMLVGGIALAAGQAPIDVVTDGSAIAQQWREAGAGTARVQMQIPASFGQLGTTSNHDFAILTNGTQRINVEAGGAVVVGNIVAATAELMVNSLADGSISLIANNTATTSVDIARFQVNTTNRFRFLNTGEAIFGLASSLSGKLTFAASGGANTQTIQPADVPASNITYKLPTADPAAGQFLQASTPAAGIVTLTWATAVTGPSAPVGSIQFNNPLGSFDGDAGLLWDTANQQMLVGGIALASGQAPIDIVADAGAIAQQWREAGAGTARVQMQVPASFGQLGTTTNHDFALITNGVQHLMVEATGAVVVGSVIVATATLMSNAINTGDISLIANNAGGTTVDITRFQVAGSNRFRFTQLGEAILGLASTVDGKLTLSNSAGATLTSISAGNAASTLNFIWPVVDPTVGQVLSAAAPSGGNVVLSWATASGGTPGTPLNSVQFNSASAFAGNAGFLYIPASTTGNGVDISDSTITSGNLVRIAATGTAAAGNTKTALNVATSGANGTSTQTTYGAQISNTSTGTSSTNVALMAAASGGTTNRAIMVGDGSQSTQSIAANLSGATDPIINFVDGAISITTSGTNQFFSVNVTSFSVNQSVGWSSGGTATSTQDTILRRAAAANIAINGGSGASGLLLVGNATDSQTGSLTVMGSNAATNALVNVARLGINSTGTAAAGFGGILSFSAESSTTNDSQVAADNWFWTDATHATRTGALSWSIANNATVSEYLRLTTAGGGGTFVATAACLAVHDGTAPAIWTAGSYAAKLYLLGAAAVPATGVAANFSTTTLAGPVWMMLRGRGTNASPAAIQTADVLGEIQWNGQFNTSTNNQTTGCAIRAVSTETWANGANGSGLFFYTSPTGGTITLRASLENTGTLRLGATSGSFNTTTLLQVGNYASWNTDVVAAIYTGANGTKGLEIIGTAGQTASPFRIFNTTVTPDLLTVSAAGVLATWAGAGTLQANHGGVLDVNFTTVSNVTTGETDLMTFTLPQNTLNTNGDFARIEGSGTFEVSANNKRLRFYIDNTVLFDTTALAFAAATASSWRVVVTIIRTTSTTQSVIAQFVSSDAILTATATYTGSAENLATNLVLKFTGQGGASDEIYQESMIVEWNPNA